MTAMQQNWLLAIVAVAVLQLLGRLCSHRGWARPPLRLPMAALILWVALRAAPLEKLPPGSRLWISSLDDLLLVYAAVRLVVWAGLELPGSVGWWRHPPKLLVQLVTLGGWAMATVVVVRSTTRFDLVGLLTTSAILTAVIGLAAQEPLKDLLAGLELQLSDDFGIGDFLQVNDSVRGIVQSVSWHDTTLRNRDGVLIVIPNTEIAQGVFENLSASGTVCNRFTIGLDYDFPPGQARRLLERVVRQHPRVLEDPPPLISLKEFAESWISYEIGVWQREWRGGALERLRGELLEQIWYALRRDGQSIPFPVREVQPRSRGIRERQSERPTPESLCQSLGAGGIFAGMNRTQLDLIVAASQLNSYGPGEAIVEEGAEGESLYHLIEGHVEVLKRIDNGETIPVRQLGPGNVFGEMTLLLDAPRSATVRALEECLLLKVKRGNLRDLLEESPGLLERIAAMVSARQAELDSLSTEIQRERTNALLTTMKRIFFAVKGE
jgi:small-conductance mechanosensitive channel/CRP-like cAMP-binding protein